MSDGKEDFAGPRRIFGPRRVADPPPAGGNDDLASLRRAFAEDPAVVPSPETCPSPETLWSALHGELSPAEARQVVDHTASCPSCAEDWRLGLAFEGEPQEAGTEPARPTKVARLSVPLPHWKTLAAAASVVLTTIAVQGWQYLQDGRIASEVRIAAKTAGITYRTAEQEVVHTRLLKRTALPRSRCLLRWDPVKDAVSYDIRVSTADLKEVTQASGLKEPKFLVPENRLAAVGSGDQIYWQVDVILAAGRVPSARTFVNRIE